MGLARVQEVSALAAELREEQQLNAQLRAVGPSQSTNHTRSDDVSPQSFGGQDLTEEVRRCTAVCTQIWTAESVRRM